jgi:predicted O-methyltransferase YrrM
MAFIDETVRGWLADTGAAPGDPVLDAMHAAAKERNFPIVGPEVGRFLFQAARLSGAKRIFEMGSGFGYSTLWFARGLVGDGRVYHTDGDRGNTEQARDYLSRAGLLDRVVFNTGDAREVFDATPGEFDIVFMDIDKHQYPSGYERFKNRIRVGGLAVVDNLIWSGKVARGETDPDTEGIRAYVAAMWSNPSYLSSLLPIRDGVGVSLRVR